MAHRDWQLANAVIQGRMTLEEAVSKISTNKRRVRDFMALMFRQARTGKMGKGIDESIQTLNKAAGDPIPSAIPPGKKIPSAIPEGKKIPEAIPSKPMGGQETPTEIGPHGGKIVARTSTGKAIYAKQEGIHPHWGKGALTAQTEKGHEHTAPRLVEHRGKHYVKSAHNSDTGEAYYHEHDPDRHLIDKKSGFGKTKVTYQHPDGSTIHQVHGQPKHSMRPGDLPDEINDPHHGKLSIRGHDSDMNSTYYHSKKDHPHWSKPMKKGYSNPQENALDMMAGRQSQIEPNDPREMLMRSIGQDQPVLQKAMEEKACKACGVSYMKKGDEDDKGRCPNCEANFKSVRWHEGDLA